MPSPIRGDMELSDVLNLTPVAMHYCFTNDFLLSNIGLPLAYRDNCAHFLIPLNKCRRQNYFLPFRCVDERHTYEKCQYEE
jgi:hypothetical protein